MAKIIHPEIQNQTGADTFRLVPAEPYTDDYDVLLDIAQEEQRNGERLFPQAASANVNIHVIISADNFFFITYFLLCLIP